MNCICEQLGFEVERKSVVVALGYYANLGTVGVRLFSNRDKAIVYKEAVERIMKKQNITGHIKITERFVDETTAERYGVKHDRC